MSEIGRLLALADGRLKDYQGAIVAKLSSDVQLELAYDVIRACATAAIARFIRRRSSNWNSIRAASRRTLCPFLVRAFELSETESHPHSSQTLCSK